MDRKQFEETQKDLSAPIIQSVPIYERDEIIFTELDIKFLVGRIIQSVGKRFTASEIGMHADMIGAEIFRNAMKNRIDKLKEKRIIPNWNTLLDKGDLHPSDLHFLEKWTEKIG